MEKAIRPAVISANFPLYISASARSAPSTPNTAPLAPMDPTNRLVSSSYPAEKTFPTSPEITYITIRATRPGKQTIKSLKTQRGKKLKVSWKKDSKANGYQIQYSTDKKFRKSVKSITISKNKTTSKTISNLKKGKQYYVRVRSYSINPGTGAKLYGTWSNTKRSSKIK